MTDAPWDPVAAVAAPRTPGATPHDAVRLHYLEALARRAQGYEGAVRNLLDDKLRQALAHYPPTHSPAPAPAPAQGHRPPQDRASAPLAEAPRALSSARPSALVDLTRQLAQQLPHNAAATVPDRSAPGHGVGLGVQPELKSVRYFRDTWTQLSVDKQLTQALAQAPENAGPLNSHQLVLRSLAVMRDTAPDYLNRFMSYVDALLWLEQAESQPVAPTAPAGDAAKKRKPSRPRAR